MEEIKMEVKTLTNDNFKDFINQNDAVLVDFWAVWCGPCRLVGPVLEKLCKEDVIQVGKVNVDDEELIASAFSIESIPTMMIFKAGKLVAKTVGYQSENILKKWIEENK